MNSLVFDIETGPLPAAEMAAAFVPFDPLDVKLGNLKDPEKIRAKLAEAEAAHVANFTERAALDALTGQVLAIGLVYRDSGEYLVLTADGTPSGEARMLREFWPLCQGDMGRINQLIGFNSASFDWPFLIRRSWRHHIPIPLGIRKGRYWSEQLVDLRDLWQLGDKLARGSLDAVSKFLGLPGKMGNGKDFAEKYYSDRALALAYLEQDCRLTAAVAERLMEPVWAGATKPVWAT